MRKTSKIVFLVNPSSFSAVSSEVRAAGATLLSANPNLIRPIGQDSWRMEVESSSLMPRSTLSCLLSLARSHVVRFPSGSGNLTRSHQTCPVC